MHGSSGGGGGAALWPQRARTAPERTCFTAELALVAAALPAWRDRQHPCPSLLPLLGGVHGQELCLDPGHIALLQQVPLAAVCQGGVAAQVCRVWQLLAGCVRAAGRSHLGLQTASGQAHSSSCKQQFASGQRDRPAVQAEKSCSVSFAPNLALWLTHSLMAELQLQHTAQGCNRVRGSLAWSSSGLVAYASHNCSQDPAHPAGPPRARQHRVLDQLRCAAHQLGIGARMHSGAQQVLAQVAVQSSSRLGTPAVRCMCGRCRAAVATSRGACSGPRRSVTSCVPCGHAARQPS